VRSEREEIADARLYNGGGSTPPETRTVSLSRFNQVVRSTAELESLIGVPSELVIKKQLAEFDNHMREFVGRAPIALLGTVGSDGKCDVSPRGDLPAVAAVLDSRTLVIPERLGNRRADSLRNILQTGRIGLLLLVPGVGETLRINGRACVMRDEAVLSTLTVNGKQPVLGIGVEVEECYFQCAKALIRSRLWEHLPSAASGPTFDFAEVLIDQTGVAETVETLQQQIEASYRERLY
jgi:PPOX class probable FMN-dependent enzyme